MKRGVITCRDSLLSVDIVATSLERKLGLKFREHLPKNNGMLFIFPEARQLSFWMEDTVIPLSIAFLTEGGQILNIEDMSPNSLESTKSACKAKYALETNKGWFIDNGIVPGDYVIFN